MSNSLISNLLRDFNANSNANDIALKHNLSVGQIIALLNSIKPNDAQFVPAQSLLASLRLTTPRVVHQPPVLIKPPPAPPGVKPAYPPVAGFTFSIDASDPYGYHVRWTQNSQLFIRFEISADGQNYTLDHIANPNDAGTFDNSYNTYLEVGVTYYYRARYQNDANTPTLVGNYNVLFDTGKVLPIDGIDNLFIVQETRQLFLVNFPNERNANIILSKQQGLGSVQEFYDGPANSPVTYDNGTQIAQGQQLRVTAQYHIGSPTGIVTTSPFITVA